MSSASSTPAGSIHLAPLTLERCIDHVKLLASENPSAAAKGAEYFQDHVTRMPYRKQVVRAAFAELAQGKGCQNTIPIALDQIMGSCIAFIVDKKAFNATPDEIQEMEGMWFRKSLIKGAIALQRHISPGTAAKFTQAPKDIKLLSELIAYLQTTLAVSGDMPISVFSQDGIRPGLKVEILAGYVKHPSGEYVEPDPDTDDEEEVALRQLEKTKVFLIQAAERPK